MDNQNNDFMSVFNGNHVDVEQNNQQNIQSQGMFSMNNQNISNDQEIPEEKAHISIVNPSKANSTNKSTYGSHENVENDNRLKSLGVDTNQVETIENKTTYGLLDKEEYKNENKPHSKIYILLGVCLFLFATALAIYLVIDYFGII